MITQKLKNKLNTILQSYFKPLKNKRDRKKLKNDNFSIITNHCMGGFIYHDLGKKFLSPTINLKILPDDFIEFVKHLEHYLSQEIIPAPEKKENYPVGKIKRIEGGYIYIYFVHYTDFNEAVKTWHNRAKRINWDNLFIMMTARDGCQYSTLQDFDKLKYESKICFTSEPHTEFTSCKYARLDNGKPLKGYISDMVNIYGKRAFECNGFDYIQFLNKEKV